MAETFTKLAGSILASTVWQEPNATRITWIALLAMSDRNGIVAASVPGLAHMARVTLQECEQALATFLAPDPYSRTPEHEGRRIEKVVGGWRLLNHELYRNRRDDDTTAERKREWDRQNRPHRDRRPENPDNDPTQPDATRQNPTQPDTVRLSPTEPDEARRGTTQADADADAKSSKAKATRANALTAPEGVDPQVWDDWLKLRRTKKAPVTETVLKAARIEARKASLTLNQFLAIWCFRGSQGLQASWLGEEDFARVNRSTPAPSKTLSAIQKLQGMRSDAPRTMDSGRDPGRLEPAGLLEPGSDPGR